MFCDIKHFISVVMFAALYINVIRIHLSFFQVISSIQTQQRERKEEEDEEEKKTRLLFILISKQKRYLQRITFPLNM